MPFLYFTIAEIKLRFQFIYIDVQFKKILNILVVVMMMLWDVEFHFLNFNFAKFELIAKNHFDFDVSSVVFL